MSVGTVAAWTARAAYDVHTARVIGRTAPTRGIASFGELVKQAITTEAHASGARAFGIVDNGSPHNGARSITRMHAAWPTAAGATLHPRQLAEPGGDLLLHPATHG